MPIKYVNGVPTLYNWTQADEDAQQAEYKAKSDQMLAQQAEYNRNWRPGPVGPVVPVNPDTFSYTSPSQAPTLPSVPSYRDTEFEEAPSYTAPTYKELPTYTAKEWDEGEISSLTQKRAAVGLREAREAMQGITGRKFSSPQVMRMTLRDALRGFGSAVDKTIGAASEAAAGEYSTKYGRETAAEQAEYQSNITAAQSFNENLRDYSKTNFSTLMANWQAKQAAKTHAADMAYDASKMRYQAQLSDYEKQRERYVATRISSTLNGGFYGRLFQAHHCW